MSDPSEKTQRFEIAPLAKASTSRRGVLTVLGGPQAGTVLEIVEPALVFGRAADAIGLDDPSLSRKHARFFRMAGGFVVEDLGSTNGTFVDEKRISSPTHLPDGAGVQLGKATLLRFTLRDGAELEASQRTYEATVRDALTGLHNRAYLDERIAAELSFARRHGTPLSVIFIDADRFKLVNDTHGHAGGDAVLRALAAFIRGTLRTEDVAARYGGEELVLLLRGIEERGAFTVADRIRVGVEKLRIEHAGARIPVTVSIGISTQSKDRLYATGEELIEAADAALYRAKERGRNRVEVS